MGHILLSGGQAHFPEHPKLHLQLFLPMVPQRDLPDLPIQLWAHVGLHVGGKRPAPPVKLHLMGMEDGLRAPGQLPGFLSQPGHQMDAPVPPQRVRPPAGQQHVPPFGKPQPAIREKKGIVPIGKQLCFRHCFGPGHPAGPVRFFFRGLSLKRRAFKFPNYNTVGRRLFLQ